jgi:hypothetical protein
MLTSNEVTQEMIDALAAEAAEAGDTAMVRDCRNANTNVDSFRRVLEALRNAQAQQ